ncbi:MAG TPA: hypothetical protein VM103_02815, partial [Candidatus Paceibacterota bacterium]|nr:hypothetical protein [Candidatus Paceibacterota bacterium]
LEKKMFDDVTGEQLMQQILVSPLPTMPDEVDVALLYQAELYNEELMQEVMEKDEEEELPGLDPAEIHARLLDETDPNDIPKDFLLCIKEGVAGWSPQ